MHYVVIGFAPVYFVAGGIDIRRIAILLAAGRLLSAPVKLIAGSLYDRRGGPWATRLMMWMTSVTGVLLILLPARIGVYLLVPFVGVAVSVLPVSNAMLVAALPERSGWGIGIFRASLLGLAGLLAGCVSLLLKYFELETLMFAALGIPALVAFSMHRALKDPRQPNTSTRT